jgi:predicted DNA-binding transcriptional regulator YafY
MPISKSAFRRYQIIDKMIRNKMKRYPTMNEIIYEIKEILHYDVSPETIQKDIARMKETTPDGFDAPIYYNRTFRGYAYKDDGYVLAGVPLTDIDLVTIKESIEFIRIISGSRISEKFNNAMEKVLSISLEEFQGGIKTQAILQTMSPPQSRGFEHFDLFYNACREKTPVSLIHYSYKKRNFSAFTIHPILIKEFENKWYIIGYSEKHSEVRTFGLDRVFDPIEVKKKYIQKEYDEIIKEYQDYYGVFPIANKKKQKIEIYVKPLQTYYFEAYPIHESQKIKKKENGSSIVSFNMKPTIEFTKLILSYGSQIKVVKPLWLSDLIQKLK